MIPVVHPGSRIRILTLYPSWIPNPGVKKVPNPGSGSAKLQLGKAFEGNQNDAYNIRTRIFFHVGLEVCDWLSFFSADSLIEDAVLVSSLPIYAFLQFMIILYKARRIQARSVYSQHTLFIPIFLIQTTLRML
jgi:hypothetical protein